MLVVWWSRVIVYALSDGNNRQYGIMSWGGGKAKPQMTQRLSPSKYLETIIKSKDQTSINLKKYVRKR